LTFPPIAVEYSLVRVFQLLPEDCGPSLGNLPVRPAFGSGGALTYSEEYVMETTIEVPKAFSVRDDHEFLAFKHLMARLNPDLCVRQVGIGLHASSGYTVFWGLVYLAGQRVTREEFDAALQEAGFDLQHNAAHVDYATVP
jgi:hypothetical protein